MSRSKESITTIEPLSYGTRMRIENNVGDGAIFAAHYMHDGKSLNMYWPAKNLDAIKEAVNEANGEEVQWIEDIHGDTEAELKNGLFWYTPMHDGIVPHAGIQLEITDPAKVESFLETAAQLAQKTSADSIKLPSDLSNRIKQFYSSSIQPKHLQ